MRLAINEAQFAGQAGEVPIGAIVVLDGIVIGKGTNRTRRDGVVHAHAEITALAEAERNTGDFRLDGAILYVTVEPCLMCLGAIYQARIARVVYGAEEPKFGALCSRFDLAEHPTLRRLQFEGGLMAEETAALLGDFFKNLRDNR